MKIDNEPTGENKRKLKSNLPIVTCSCGAKILVVPDVAAMSLAIKNHLAEHKDADEKFLISQILDAASKQAPP